jgi:hypothetical protein
VILPASGRRTARGDLVEPELAVDPAIEVACVFVGRIVPVSGSPEAIRPLLDVSCLPLTGPNAEGRQYLLKGVASASCCRRRRGGNARRSDWLRVWPRGLSTVDRGASVRERGDIVNDRRVVEVEECDDDLDGG